MSQRFNRANARTFERDRGHFVSRIAFVIIPALALMATLPVEAEMFGPGFQPCGEKASTLAVVECVQAKTALADQRLNAAYKALQARVDPLNVNRCYRRNACGSNTGTPIAAFTEPRTGQSGRCRQPNVCAR